MRIDQSHLTYCLNVHPGEGLEDITKSIETHTLAVKNRICPDAPFGVGLRIANEASIELSQPEALSEFKAFLDSHDLYCFTINAFPYGNFHSGSVKEAVYRPDWSQPERYKYTLRCAQILAALLPEECEGSISSVPLSYKGFDDYSEEVAIQQLQQIARELRSIHQQSGRKIVLALEPEPDCTLETTPESIAFHQKLDELSREYIGICFDTCHMALQFEDLQTSLKALKAAGVPIAKLQLSSAPRCQQIPPIYNESIYLHQVKVKTAAGSIESFNDLPAALSCPDSTNWQEARIHFHLPLYFDGDRNSGTTNQLLNGDFFSCAQSCGISHYEIETYTFDVLPPELKERGIVQSIIDEYRFVLERRS